MVLFSTSKLLAIGAFLSLIYLPTHAQAAFAHIATTTAVYADDNATTGAIDTNTASLVVCLTAAHTSGSGGTVVDVGVSANTWTAVASTDINAQLWYSQLANKGASHQFRYSGTGNYGTIVCAAFSGSHSTPFNNQQSDALQASGTTIQPGSLTPSVDDALVVTGVGFYVPHGGMSVNGDYAANAAGNEQSGVGRGGYISWSIQTSAAATNPTWTSVNNNTMRATLAVFKPVTGGGGGTGSSSMLLLGVGGE